MNKNRLVKKKVVKKEKPELLIYNKNKMETQMKWI